MICFSAVIHALTHEDIFLIFPLVVRRTTRGKIKKIRGSVVGHMKLLVPCTRCRSVDCQYNIKGHFSQVGLQAA